MPITALRTEYNVPEHFRQSLDGISVHGLLAIDLMLDDSPSRQVWKTILPLKENMMKSLPYWWESKLQRLLPDAAVRSLVQQKDKLGRDWNLVSKKYPTLVRDEFEYFWFLVNTRTFYYTDQASDEVKDPNECLAMMPFADYFNHASSACKVTFSTEGYHFTAQHKIKRGEEIFISYGQHSNDFLLAEYGFTLEDNECDTVLLDPVLLPLFDDGCKAILKSQNYWADYLLDANGACYRTQVAIRLLCMPQKSWLKSLEQGVDENDDYQKNVDGVMQKCLKKYVLMARKRLNQVAKLDERFSFQKDVLRQRWEQILGLVLDSLTNQAIGM